MDQYLLIPFLRGVNIHLPAILMFTRGTRFWHTAIWPLKVNVLGSFEAQSFQHRLRCWDLWAWHWHPRLRQGQKKMGGMVVGRTFGSTLNEFHGTFPSWWSHSCMNKEPFPDIWGAAGWWNVVDSRAWTLSPFFHRHHCEQSRSSIQVSRLLRVLGLASYLMVQTVQNIWVCPKIVYPYTHWLMIIIPAKWL